MTDPNAPVESLVPTVDTAAKAVMDAENAKLAAFVKEIAQPADYPLVANASGYPGYAASLQLGFLQGFLVQAYVAPHSGQTPPKVWVVVPGQTQPE